MKPKLLLSLLAAGGTVLSLEGIAHRTFKLGFKRVEREPDPKKVSYFESLSYQEMSIVNKDGLRLYGYYIPEQDAKMTFILIHGYHGSHYSMAPYIKAIRESFYCNIFVADNRAHGKSEGEYIGFGLKDADDIEEWLPHILEKTGNLPLVFLGVSMGGAAVCELSSRDLPHTLCFIEDCGYDTLYNQFGYQMRKDYHLALSPVMFSLERYMKKYCGYTFKDVMPITSIKHAKKPVLFIHGGADTSNPTEMVYPLYDACPTEKELLIVPDAKHARSIQTDEKLYMDHVIKFISKCYETQR